MIDGWIGLLIAFLVVTLIVIGELFLGDDISTPHYRFPFLLDFSLLENNDSPVAEEASENILAEMPRVTELLNDEGLIEKEIAVNEQEPFDVTRNSLKFPASREARLQNLARGDEGFLLALAYSTQRGRAKTHPFAGENRMVEVSVENIPEELGYPIQVGEITMNMV